MAERLASGTYQHDQAGGALPAARLCTLADYSRLASKDTLAEQLNGNRNHGSSWAHVENVQLMPRQQGF